jgi:hypothetical protein
MVRDVLNRKSVNAGASQVALHQPTANQFARLASDRWKCPCSSSRHRCELKGISATDLTGGLREIYRVYAGDIHPMRQHCKRAAWGATTCLMICSRECGTGDLQDKAKKACVDKCLPPCAEANKRPPRTRPQAQQ